jgi:succinoglycan biosynthesis transport protein ExoP
VLIAAPPAFATAQVRLLTSIADTLIFAIRWGSTARETVRNALQLLWQPGLNGRKPSVRIDTVLTRVDMKKHARYRFGDTGEFLINHGTSLAQPVLTSIRANVDRPDHPAAAEPHVLSPGRSRR